MKVLYILGFGRSGSTILDLVLGELDGFFSAGELQSLWRESLLDGRLCGCGTPVADCVLWERVLGGPDCRRLGAAPEEIAALQRDRLRVPVFGPRFRVRGASEVDWKAYSGILASLYRRVADVTGARVIVDSSKLPSAARALEELPEIDVHYLHLVRDPRAVAFSWMRTKQAVDRTTGGEMDRLSPRRAAVTWTARQLASERVCARAGERSLLMRYEDFVADPAGWTSRVAALVDEDQAVDGFIEGTTVLTGRNHTVSGNPVRLRSGTMQLREDAEWKLEMPRVARATVQALSLPLLARYGYL